MLNRRSSPSTCLLFSSTAERGGRGLGATPSRNRTGRALRGCLLGLLALATPAAEEEGGDTAGKAPPGAEREAAARTAAIEEGKLMYAIYCQSCHGPGGRGDGPGAKMLERKPPDLTRLSRDQGGDFPLVRVLATIDGRERVPDHEGQMPIWGLSLQQSDADANQEGEVREKLRQLAEYLRSIQDVD